MIVEKYGGSSLSSVGKIKTVAKHVVEVSKKEKVVVVVSAMGKETDNLIGDMKKVSGEEPPEELMDRLLVTGEERTAVFLTAAINGLGKRAECLTGRDIKLETDEEKRIKGVRNVGIIKDLLETDCVVVVTGFQGIIEKTNRIVTLGRGGSDLTAIAIAAALEADYCKNFTDVDGIYTVDPRIVPNARRFDRVSYNRLIGLTGVGKGKFTDRSIILALNLGVKIWVCISSSLGESTGGTLVCSGGGVEEMETQDQTGLVVQRAEQIKLYGIPNKPGAAAGIFGGLSDINIVDSAQSTNKKSADITLFFLEEDKEKIMARLRSVKENTDLIREISDPVSVSGLALVCPLMKEKPNYFYRVFDAIHRRANANVESFSSSNITILVIVSRKDEVKAARALASEFQLVD